MTTLQNLLTDKVLKAIPTEHLQVINESHQHNVPAFAETHFKLIIVSHYFAQKSLRERHQFINDLFKSEFQNHTFHALSMNLYTLEEWEHSKNHVPASPLCQKRIIKQDD